MGWSDISMVWYGNSSRRQRFQDVFRYENKSTHSSEMVSGGRCDVIYGEVRGVDSQCDDIGIGVGVVELAN